MKIFYVLVIYILLNVVDAKVYEFCDLARKLHCDHGFNRNTLPDWMCLIQAESSYNSKAVGPPNSDGSRDYGLWQINDRYWCKNGKKGGDCNMDCQKLLDDNLADDVVCVRKIHQRHGYNAWYGWIKSCKGKALPNTEKCF
ncbi:CLUMA_CG018045, isoform A [Clunio marinus]|uniref:lysozyme n=1 Tax=Clunio marinus TaxID=568069 RepID=A0A1J1IY21_9DIPT|nr:CLUMA_CG018045, isoform A [Clunio marinus]